MALSQCKMYFGQTFSWFFSFQCMILVSLTLQTSAMVLILRYSRTKGLLDGQYLSSTAIFFAEIAKFVICVIILWKQKGYSTYRTSGVLKSEVWNHPEETCKLIIPSILYTLQNNLLFYALTVLDAGTYQVTYQLKILATALFSVYILQRVIRPLQWASLLMLLAGVAIVQVQNPTSLSSTCADNPTSAGCLDVMQPVSLRSQLTGLVSIVAACLCSGYACVYYEQLVKHGAQPSVVIRNIQLGIFTIIFGAVGILYNDWYEIYQKGFFQGYNWLTSIVILFQATGGLTVAATIKYTDNIQKSFAASISIVLSSVCSYYMLHSPAPPLLFNIGVCLVIFATILYAYFSTPQPAQSQDKEISDTLEDVEKLVTIKEDKVVK